MVEEQAARPQHVEGDLEVGRRHRLSHMLEHPHARHLLERSQAARVPVVQQLDAAAVLKPRSRDPLPGEFELALRRRDAANGRRTPSRHASPVHPAAPDVEKPLVGGKPSGP